MLDSLVLFLPANGFAETRHRSSSRSSLALDRIPIADRVRAELASNLARSASTWHKDQHGIDSDHGSILSTPPHDLRSLGAIANFVRRSRTLFASSIDLRSLRDRSDLASSDTFARANVRDCSDRTCSISDSPRPFGKNFHGSHRRDTDPLHFFSGPLTRNFAFPSVL